ncbi:MAG: hypothetical protein JW784_00550 [Candidatus Cloacimonetes bacterium]|nr:hypothetical protein [Candidatus Cloacimonadota bacterium]
MRALKVVLLILVVLMLIPACGRSGPKDVKKAYYPDWWQVQDSPDYVQTFGMATKVSQNSSYDAAHANAMLQAAQFVENYVKGMVKNYEEEAGVNDPQVLALTSKVVKEVANAKFENALVSKQETIILEDNHYQTFLRVSIPKDAINKNTLNKIRNEEALYNQFKASQAFNELDKEIEDYDK